MKKILSCLRWQMEVCSAVWKVIKSFNILMYVSSLQNKFTSKIQGKCKKLFLVYSLYLFAIIQKSLIIRSNGYSFRYLMFHQLIMITTNLICSRYMFIFACLLHIWSRNSSQTITHHEAQHVKLCMRKEWSWTCIQHFMFCKNHGNTNWWKSSISCQPNFKSLQYLPVSYLSKVCKSQDQNTRDETDESTNLTENKNWKETN